MKKDRVSLCFAIGMLCLLVVVILACGGTPTPPPTDTPSAGVMDFQPFPPASDRLIAPDGSPDPALEIDVDGMARWYSGSSAKTSSPYTVVASERGETFTDQGSSSDVEFDLPAAAEGLWYCFYNFAGNIIYADPATGDQIHHLTNAAGDRISNGTAGDSICLVAVDATYWIPLQEIGTWADAD